MKLLALACFVGLVVAEVPLVAEAPLELAKPFGKDLAEVGEPPIVADYHAEIGIPEAARIRAAEEAMDFSGGRIVGGSGVSLGEYPHMAGLVITVTTGQSSVCGSSLISNTKIVTAAHCWRSSGFQAAHFEVVLGSTTLYHGGIRTVTSDVILHPNYNQVAVHNDIAIGTISWVNFNNIIQPIALASGTDEFVGVWTWAAGFGIQRDGTGISNSQSLHHVSMQVITNNVCWATYWGAVQPSTICTATTGGRSVCGGDSGGPLETNVGGVRTLVGVASFGHVSGCERNHPAGFARVTSFNAWIRSHM